MSQPQPPPRPTVNVTAVVVSSVVLVLGMLGAAVALSYAGRSVEAISGLLGAVGTVGALIVPVIGKLFAIASETRNQTQALEKIAEQGNGNDR